MVGVGCGRPLDVGDGFVRFVAGTDGMVRGRGRGKRVKMSLRTGQSGQSDAVQYAILASPQHHHACVCMCIVSATPCNSPAQPSPAQAIVLMRGICSDLAAVVVILAAVGKNTR